MSRRSKVFVMTLPGDEARRAPLLAELARQGIAHELVMGIDGRAGLPPELEAMVDRDLAARTMRRRLTDGELACALSHRAIYQRILDEGLDAALVLEDDALIQPRLGDFLRAGGMFARPMILLDYARVSVSRISGQQFGDFGRLWRVVVNPPFATGYIVSARSARHLLRVTTPIGSVADWPGDLYHARAYALSPRLVDHLPIGNPMSHLSPEREPAMPHGQGKPRWRYLTRAYWRGIVRRRASMRIDP